MKNNRLISGKTLVKDYYENFPIATLCNIKDDKLEIRLEIIKPDARLNDLKPRINLIYYEDQYGSFSWTTDLYDRVLFIIQLFILIAWLIVEIVRIVK